MKSPYAWWQTGIVYQIYPRSFQDSNGDGIGDLEGITQRLDYLEGLNVDAVWLSPIFPSPMYDFGYDVSDYTAVDPIFGDLADFDRLLAKLHERGIRLLLDLVPNHTSDQHAWFLESCHSRDNPKRDWYIWADPGRGGGPPNNWLSFFGGPAWTFHPPTGQYYLHQFSRRQPELNYRHPEVLPALLDQMCFWLERGVDGFRVDVLWTLLKDEQLRDEPVNPDWDGIVPHHSLLHVHTQDLPGVHDLVREMRRSLDQYDDRLMVGEIYLPVPRLVQYYGADLDECHLPFNFQLLDIKWEAAVLKEAVDAYESALPPGAWPNWVLGNHDRPRIATRLGPGQARLACLLLLTLRGTPTVYYGDEIGMRDVPIPPELTRDPLALNQPRLAARLGRDPARTPMQWEDRPGGGFTCQKSTPWLPLASDCRSCNVAGQRRDPLSNLRLFETLTRLRRQEPSLNRGDYSSLGTGDTGDIFAFTRAAPEADPFLICLNLGSSKQTLDLSRLGERASIALSTGLIRHGMVSLSTLSLDPDEGLLLRLSREHCQESS
ncbi:MAG: alpha-amylase family glycosyl hydrolase [Acidobacteriota bacterium]